MSASTHSPVLKHHFEDLGQQHACERLGMWMFLATEILFFGGLFGAYTVYRLWYPHEFEFASSHLNRVFATVNTMFLITSSLTMTLAIRSAKLGDKGALVRNLLITAALATAFMVVKGFEYAEDFHEHLVPGPGFSADIGKEASDKGLDPGKVQLFLCFYYVMTGIHGIHIIIGIGCILWLVWEAWRGAIPPENYSTVEVVSLYWHLVDAIWLFLMPLLYLAGAGYGAHH
ncbi:cytochrome c oxidase subunit 3 [Frigoriglobus tundricola]|uniref:Cytochrome c oxidase polypeptide III n=1 Tax=Frigoriglobus tundricola TaxID=2774151 RepID=A0A6M5YID9_9BACT|nr:cytochrome c oxidase subunit 3 [Frigoriglobus tundricola]QJW93849.1 Cytochrome c oxidase polypeptide III [Frigoriglobus tundricola]